MNKDSWGLHWFRRDLRVLGNPALQQNWKRNNGRVIGVFCIDREFLRRPDFSAARFAFFLKTLEALQIELQAAGGDLLVIEKPPRMFFKELPVELERREIPLPQIISWNRDYEPFARKRDTEVAEVLRQAGCEVLTLPDHLIIEPHEVSRDTSKEAGHYSVYTPFFKKWFEEIKSERMQARMALAAKALPVNSVARKNLQDPGKKIFSLTWQELYGYDQFPEDQLARILAETLAVNPIQLPAAGTAAALGAIESFRSKLEMYEHDRNFPALSATSQLSVYFKNGSLTTAQALAALSLTKNLQNLKNGPLQFLKEVAWREFYYHLLFHCPQVEGQAFKVSCRELEWENNTAWFEAWKSGQTGFPIVDAGMRELQKTGRMHNRVRMIVASFLTKDLLIDWRWGERYFMQTLLDGDMAANNGGWQWAASTGSDAQPYFRVFNPKLQSQKFDPDGAYIATHVQELAHLKGTEEIHDPFQNSNSVKLCNYPTPIVDHNKQRLKAIALFAKIRPKTQSSGNKLP